MSARAGDCRRPGQHNPRRWMAIVLSLGLLLTGGASPFVAVPALVEAAVVSHPAHAATVPGDWPALPNYEDIDAALVRAAAGTLPPGYPTLHGTPRVPAVLLKAMAWVESRWRQDRAPGVVLISPDGGYGVMQVTSAMVAGGAAPPVQSAIANNYIYNIAYAAQMLTDKWLTTPVIGTGDPDMLESWYYAVWAFNGWGPVNNPNNPAFTRVGTPETSPWAFPYQERVYYFVAHPPLDATGQPLWPAVPVDPPTAADIQAAGAGPLAEPASPHRVVPAASASPLLPCPSASQQTAAGSQQVVDCVPWADHAAFLADEETPDGMTVAAGQVLLKGWLVRNSGGTFWNSTAARTAGYHLQRLSDGGGFGGATRIDIPEVPPLAAVDLRASLSAPLTPGTHTAYWQMEDGQNHPFGPRMWISVVVPGGQSDASGSPPATPTASPPTAEPTPPPVASAVPSSARGTRVEAFRLKATDALYAADLSVPDWTVMTPGQHFEKGWLLRNVGTVTWTPSFHLAFEAGTRMGPNMLIRAPIVAPAATGPFTVSLVAPLKPGRYRGIWQMTDASQRPFGEQVWVAITVVSPGGATSTAAPPPETSPTMTPAPTATEEGKPATATPAPSVLPSPSVTVAVPSPLPSPSPALPTESGPAAWLGPVASSAYFAEGYTGGGTSQYLSLFNPGASPAGVRVTLYRADGSSRILSLKLRPFELRSVNVAQLAPHASLSLRVDADHFVAVERTMYEGTGGHAAAAVVRPARHWTFTHVLIQGGFTEWLPLFNPGDEALSATITVTSGTGVAPRVFTAYVPAHTRQTVSLARYVGQGGSQSISVDSSQPVVAEHVAYFNHGQTMVAHSGSPAPSTAWYFAEGATDGGRMAYLPVVNPAASTAIVTLTLIMSDGTWLERYVKMPPHSSHVFGLHHLVRSPGVSAILRSTIPVYTEESLYLAGRRGAAIVGGASHAARTWYLAEGYTSGSFRESLVILNPGSQQAVVRVRYATTGGSLAVKVVRVPPRSRLGWAVNRDVASGNVAVAFSSAVPIVVGRGEEFHDGWGLTSSVGIWGPAATP